MFIIQFPMVSIGNGAIQPFPYPLPLLASCYGGLAYLSILARRLADMGRR
jgi:hypothetical protein